MGDGGDLINGSEEGLLVVLRGLGKSANLAHKLKRGCANLVLGGWRLEVEQRLDIATHGDSMTSIGCMIERAQVYHARLARERIILAKRQPNQHIARGSQPRRPGALIGFIGQRRPASVERMLERLLLGGRTWRVASGA